MKKFCVDFCETIGLQAFNRDKWFTATFATMQRTNRGGTTNAQRTEIKEFLYTELYDPRFKFKNQGEFDVWFYAAAEKVQTIGNLTFGQSQKVINILFKYYFCFYYSEKDSKFNELHKFLVNSFSYFHAPIDNIVLLELKRKYNAEDLNNIIIIGGQARFIIDGYKVPWSKLDNKMTYNNIQSFIQRLTNQRILSCKLEFETKNLWIR